MSEQAQTFDFELVSPERRLMSVAARMVVVPGEEGDVGVLANHSPLVVSVRPGVVQVFAGAENDKPQRLFIAGGFADISGDNCTVLAEDAINVDELDEGTLVQDIANLKEDLTMVEGAADKARVEKALVLAKAKLEAVTGHIVF